MQRLIDETNASINSDVDKKGQEITMLDSEKVETYRKDGFVVIGPEEWLAPDEFSHIRAEVERIQYLGESRDKWMVYLDQLSSGDLRLNRIENFLPWSELLSNLFSSNRLGAAASQLLGEPAIVFKDKINFKQPGGDGFLPHQDAQAGWDEFGHSTHLSVAVAIDKCTAENGALEFVPGRHLEGLLGPVGSELPADFVDDSNWQLIEANPGSVIFFDSYAPHRSAPNHSDSQRRLVYITYCLEREGDFRLDYFDRKRLSYPPNILRKPGIDYAYKI